MIDDSCNRIVNNLESLFHIGFGIKNSRTEHYSKFRIFPSDDDLFFVEFTFTPTRISADFGTNIGSTFVHNMGQQTTSKRELMARHLKLIGNMGYKIKVSVNGSSLDLEDVDTWPNDWKDLHLHVTRTLNEDESDHIIVNDLSPYIVSAILSLADLEPNDSEWNRMEGEEKHRWIKSYERNPANRSLCISVKGDRCCICGLDFGQRYGDIGLGFIHVHHLVPLSRMDGPRELDPLKDLVPVCPNCHYMLHRRDPPYTPEELKSMMNEVSFQNN